MSFALTALLSALIVEIALRLPFAATLGGLLRAMRKTGHLIGRSTASDHWKERAILAYSGAIFRASVTLGALIAVLAAVAGLAALAIEQVVPGYWGFLIGWGGLLTCLVAASLFVWARRHV